ncbi:MAG: DUF362 domain-containing protein [Treponema sp.]|nr:DUF362 domain-containing protein [Treponema sp.]
MNKKVAVTRCTKYDSEEMYRSLKTAAEAAGLPDVAGKKVLLKPNILFDTPPEKAVTTHPVFLEAVIRLIREWGASRILVGDSPGIQGPNFTARLSGLREAALKGGAEWVDFTKEKIDLEIAEGKVHRKFQVTKAVKEADLIITLPKLKNHQLMFFTGAIKNTFGLVPSIGKTPFHVKYSSRQDFASMLVDLNLLVKPAYALMDAVTAMEGPGPSGGRPKDLGLVLASSNILALDIAACTIVGYPPLSIPTNRDGLDRQFWLKNLNEIEYPLLTPDQVRVRDFEKIPFKKSRSQLVDFIIPKPIRSLFKTKDPQPYINHQSCIRCGDCIQICAAGAMYFSGQGVSKQVEINREKCISCYCCHEICPAKAIDIK